MGADSFIAMYGIKIALDPDDEDEQDACGSDTDPRCQAARRAGLESFSGRMTDGEDYFLYIGQRVAWLGVEHDPHAVSSAEELQAMAQEVAQRLKAAGFAQAPALHLQLMAQY